MAYTDQVCPQELDTQDSGICWQERRRKRNSSLQCGVRCDIQQHGNHFATKREDVVNSLKMNEEILKES